MDNSAYFHHDSDNGFETYWDGNGNQLAGLGDTTAPAAPSGNWLTDLVSNISSTVKDVAPAVASIKASQQIAKTGQVPAVQVQAGVSPQVQKMLYIGGAAMLGFGLLYLLSKRGRR